LWDPAAVAYGQGQFVCVGSAVITSTDGVNWITRQLTTLLNGVTYGNGYFIAVGQGGAILQSGSIITLGITSKPGPGLLELSLSGPTGLGYTIQSSTDLISWRNVTNIVITQPTSILFDALSTSPTQVFYRAYSQ
jgi:hypothetical protein